MISSYHQNYGQYVSSFTNAMNQWKNCIIRAVSPLFVITVLRSTSDEYYPLCGNCLSENRPLIKSI